MKRSIWFKNESYEVEVSVYELLKCSIEAYYVLCSIDNPFLVEATREKIRDLASAIKGHLTPKTST